jgi:hypothetical protein
VPQYQRDRSKISHEKPFPFSIIGFYHFSYVSHIDLLDVEKKILSMALLTNLSLCIPNSTHIVDKRITKQFAGSG